MAATFKAKGTFVASGSAPAPGLPAGLAAGDFLLLVMHSVNQTIATPTDWTPAPAAIGDAFRGTAGAAGGVRCAVFYRWWQSGDVAPTIADSGDLTAAQIFAYENVDLTEPFDGVTPIGFNSAFNATMTLNGITTATDDALVVHCVALDRDSASTTNVGAPSNANLSGLAERHDQTVATNTGGGLYVCDGLKAAAGASGDTTATLAAGGWAGITLALRAKPPPPAGVPWTPGDDAARLAEWDFSNVASVTTDTGGIASVADSEGGNALAQATTTRRPDLLTGIAALDGHQAADFSNGSNDWLSASIAFSGAPVMVIAVGRLDAGADNYGRLWELTGTTFGQTFVSWDYGDGPHLVIQHGGSADNADTAVGIAEAGAAFIHIAVIAATQLEAYLNGATPAVQTHSSTPNFSGINVGNRSDGARAYDGLYAYLAISSDITTEARQRYEGYLAHRFGLAGSLPGGHPYKSAAPELPATAAPWVFAQVI